MLLSKKDYNYFLEQDRIALGHSTGFLAKLKQFLWPDLIWEYEKKLRKLEYYHNTGKYRNSIYTIDWIITKWQFRRLGYKLGFQIGLNSFGPGLSIAHFGSLIVSNNAQIGKNCRIHSCVNIGASGGSENAPIIGDNCYIGPGAKLFGEIRLGDNISIGANAVVNSDCKENNVVLAGVPAKIVKHGVSPWTVFNKTSVSDGTC